MQNLYSLDEQLADAAFISDTEQVRLLLARGASPDARDDERRTALIHAVSDRNRELARVLLEAGADPNLRDDDGWTALDVAISRRTLELVSLLAAFGADMNARGNKRRPVLTRIVLPHVVDAWQRPALN